MAKKSSAYWQKRFSALENAQNQYGQNTFHQIEPAFDKAERQIQAQIEAWYARYASNNGITLAEARKQLSAAELKELQWDVQEYIKYGQENAMNQQWMKELENASARFHISRLEALKLRTQQSLEVAFGNELDSLDGMVKRLYQSGYYHTCFEVQKGFNIGWEIGQIDERKLQKVISKPWATDGKTFSDRVWQSKTTMVNELHQQMTRTIIQGKAPDEAIKALSKYVSGKTKNAKYNAGRLVMTEQAFISSAAQKDAFNDLDVEEFEIVATLDSHTSDICREMDGKHFPMKDFQPGVTAPPFHVWCRSTTVPYFDDEWGRSGERAARGEDGKTYYVPADMTYKEWKQSFVDGDESGLQEINSDDTIELKNKIADADTQITDLKKQFSDMTDGYSYDDWFSDFSSIEEGYGELSDGDETFNKLKALDQQIKDTTQKKTELLHQKERRKQLDTGYAGKVPDDELDSFNAKAFEQIKLDTGYSDEKTTELQKVLQEYFDGDYETILSGETSTARIISDGLDVMPTYDGTVYRGLCFSEYSDSDITQFTSLKTGDVVPSKGIISSWSSDKRVAEAFGSVSTQSAESSAVILECVDNVTGVGVQHLSKFGIREAEVLSNAHYEVLEVITESKYDYVSKRKDLLYFPDDLTTLETELKKQVVCVIKVKEV